MTFSFRPAKRENSSVLVALAGHTGTGKTMSAIRLGLGLAGPGGRVALIDTESGRGTHYSDQFQYDYADMRPPFSPACYQDAIEAAEQAKYDVIIIDSFSHEWSGDGGCCDMQAETLERMANGDARRMERLSAPAWKDAKIAHKKLISRLLQTRASVIFALRAEPKVKFVKVRGEDGKERTVIEDMGFQPICEKSFMFEMTCSFMINEKHLPVPIKLPDRFRPFFPLDKPITEKSGEKLAEWAKGASLAPPEPEFVLDTPGVQGPVNLPASKPNGPPPVGNLVLLSRIGAGFLKLGFSAAKQQERWKEYCGEAAFMTEEASVADQQRLLENLRTQYAKAAE